MQEMKICREQKKHVRHAIASHALVFPKELVPVVCETTYSDMMIPSSLAVASICVPFFPVLGQLNYGVPWVKQETRGERVQIEQL